MPVVSTKEILDRAFADRYGVAAFNILDDLTIDAVLTAAEEERAPVRPPTRRRRRDGPPAHRAVRRLGSGLVTAI